MCVARSAAMSAIAGLGFGDDDDDDDVALPPPMAMAPVAMAPVAAAAAPRPVVAAPLPPLSPPSQLFASSFAPAPATPPAGRGRGRGREIPPELLAQFNFGPGVPTPPGAGAVRPPGPPGLLGPASVSPGVRFPFPRVWCTQSRAHADVSCVVWFGGRCDSEAVLPPRRAAGPCGPTSLRRRRISPWCRPSTCPIPTATARRPRRPWPTKSGSSTARALPVRPGSARSRRRR